MKRFLKKLVCLTICMTLVSVVMFSCAKKGPLDGKFEDDAKISTIVFTGDNVTLTAAGIDLKGTYTYDGKKVIMTLKTAQGDDVMEGIFESENSFYIAGTETIDKMIYTKV